MTTRASFSFRAGIVSVLFLSHLISLTAFGWGSVGHRIVARVGSKFAGGFWEANNSGMMALTTAPDVVYKRLPTARFEKPTHFFQPDSYFTDPSKFPQIPQKYADAAQKFGAPFVTKNGTSPWRIRQYYDLALSSLKEGDFEATVQYAGVMSHYIGDMSQPLHVTKNYDGQETGQEKIHAFFESKNIEDNDLDFVTGEVAKVANALLHDQKFRDQFKGTINNVAFMEIGRAFALKDTLLAVDRKQGRKGQGAENQLKIAIARMGDGAATLTMILQHLWTEAGNPSGGGTVHVKVPQWVKPAFGKQPGLDLDVCSVPQDDCA